MSRRLPPLNALRAFEAAARLLSISEAAAELHVTPAAISHQVKALEEWLGVPLFRRLNRFRSAYPDIEVRIDANPRLSDFERDSVDIGIRYGRGRYPGLRVDLLL